MIQFSFDGVAVSGVSCCVPANIVRTDVYYEAYGKETVDKFIETTGVKERHIAYPQQTASDLAYLAAERLLNKKDVDRGAIGSLLFVSQTADYRLPATAFVLQHRLGLGKDCVCFDVNLGCSGYVYGLQLMAALLSNSNIEQGLLLVGDTASKYMAPNDRSVCMLLGDAGSATLMEKRMGTHMDMAFRSDGGSFKLVIIPAGGYRNSELPREEKIWGRDGNPRTDYDLYMSGTDVFSFAFTEVPKLAKDFLKATGNGPENYDALVMHQANAYLMKQIAKRIKMSPEKVPVSIGRYGNTSNACIPVTMCDAYGGQIEGDKRMLLCGFGVGLSWGLADLTVRGTDILPIMQSDLFYTEGEVSHD